MKKFREIIDCNYDTLIKGIKINSKEVEEGDLFVCTKGANADRHDFISSAIENGAVALITAKDVDVTIPYVKVENPNEILPELCSKFYDSPEKKLNIIGITGTDGKTSTATIIQTLIGNDKCGYIGTNGVGCKSFFKETNNTTPDSDKLYEYLHDFVSAECKYVAMEASSEAFFRHRLDKIVFSNSVYTNITNDHLNIHGSLESYINCKCMLFSATTGVCVLNSEDEHFEEVKKHCNTILTYGEKDTDDLQIINYSISINKTDIKFKYKNVEYNIISPLLGKFNVYNLMAGLLLTLSMGFDINNLISNIKYIEIPGRLKKIELGQNYNVIIDYAHTPNALLNVLTFINKVKKNKVITITGSAGGRDKSKRKDMGRVVSDLSDLVIFTADDPRNEEIDDIIDDLISNLDKDNYIREPNRIKAINKAINMATKDDIILIAGRGNDTMMPYKDSFIRCNDIEEATKSIKEREMLNVR